MFHLTAFYVYLVSICSLFKFTQISCHIMCDCVTLSFLKNSCTDFDLDWISCADPFLKIFKIYFHYFCREFMQ